MQKITSPSKFFNVLSPHRPPVIRALTNLCPTSGPDHLDRGFVLFVEENDTLKDINRACRRDLETSLEGTFIDGNCLIGVVLWGNSGEGVTIVCPNVDGYVDEVAEVLRKHL